MKYFILRISIVCLLIIQAGVIRAEFVNIGIMDYYRITRMSFTVEKGVYNLFADNQKLEELKQGDLLFIILKGNKVEVKSPTKHYGHFSKIYLLGRDVENVFRTTPIFPEKEIRLYDDNLKVTVGTHVLNLVNNVNLENYIAGVVQAEVGPTPAPEFFKLQSILCRTYALENLNKHEYEGFNLCDRVHCQAYRKKCSDAAIESASKSTRGLVIVDSDINLITAAFYSNCGGQTVNSEDVWQKPVYYLQSVRDPHCVNEPNAKWTKKISKAEWSSYLRRMAGGFVTDTMLSGPFYQDSRKSHLTVGNREIPLKTIRSDFKLKSTYFTAIPDGEFMVLSGRGFGHGAGLCQEGAMKMAASGYSYPEILHFYYKDVHLVDLSVIGFFKDE